MRAAECGTPERLNSAGEASGNPVGPGSPVPRPPPQDSSCEDGPRGLGGARAFELPKRPWPRWPPTVAVTSPSDRRTTVRSDPFGCRAVAGSPVAAGGAGFTQREGSSELDGWRRAHPAWRVTDGSPSAWRDRRSRKCLGGEKSPWKNAWPVSGNGDGSRELVGGARPCSRPRVGCEPRFAVGSRLECGLRFASRLRLYGVARTASAARVTPLALPAIVPPASAGKAPPRACSGRRSFPDSFGETPGDVRPPSGGHPLASAAVGARGNGRRAAAVVTQHGCRRVRLRRVEASRGVTLARWLWLAGEASETRRTLTGCGVQQTHGPLVEEAVVVGRNHVDGTRFRRLAPSSRCRTSVRREWTPV